MECAKQIVVVEDDEDIRQALAEVLRDEGFEVTCAANGREGLRALGGNERPCLVLVDLMMPVMTGWEFISALKEDPALSTIPIIVTSACAASSPTTADRVLPKPLKLDEIITTVHEFCDADAAAVARRDAMRELARRNVELAELRRLRDDMLAMVVHDLKSPLTAIVANVEYVLAEDWHHDPEGKRVALEDVRAAAARMNRMIANLLDVARFEAGMNQGHTRLVALDEFAVEQMRRRRSLLDLYGLRFTQSLAPAHVAVDLDQLTRVTDNILDNAFRYTPRGGRIHFSSVHEGSRAILAIGNSGPAIPERARSTIFEKFAQVEPGANRMNAGLGLYFCRLAIESFGGRLTVGSTPELPTIFTIDLPLVERAPL